MIIGKAISPFALRKKNGGGGGGNDPDAQLFITATGITGTNATATNQLVVDLKAANIWTKMKAVYPFVGGTATTCKFNLKNPVDSNAAYRLVFNGGGTFSSNGYLPNGTNAYANTFLTPTGNLGLNNIHLAFYSRTDSSLANNYDIGSSYLSGTVYYTLMILRETNLFYNVLNVSQANAGLANASNTNSLGFYTANRTGVNAVTGFKNGTKILTNTTASSASSTTPIYIGALDYNNAAQSYSNKQCAFASIGDGLTDAESLAFYNAVQLFNTTLGRQV